VRQITYTIDYLVAYRIGYLFAYTIGYWPLAHIQTPTCRWSYGGEAAEVLQYMEGCPTSSHIPGLACSVCTRTFVNQKSMREHRCCADRGSSTAADEAAAAVQQVHAMDASSAILRRLTDMRIDRHLGNAAINEIKQFTVGVLQSVKQALLARLTCALGATLREAVTNVFNVFQGLQTDAQEAAARARLLPLVEPVQRKLGDVTESLVVEGGRTVQTKTPAYIWEVPFHQALSKILKHSPTVLKQVIESASRWREDVASRKGKKQKTNKVYCDIEHGSGFEAFMAAVMADAPEGAYPLAIILYYDGLEVVNGLGHAKGTHKLGCFYWALVNIEQEQRMDLNMIHLHAVCLEKHVTVFGPEATISGHLNDTKDSSSWGFSMRALQRGAVTISVPDPSSTTGESNRQFCGGMCLLSADTPAACLLCGFKTTHGPFTKSLCRHCYCNQHHPTDPKLHGPYRQPTTNLPKGWDVGERTRKFELRTAVKHKREGALNAKMSKTDAEKDAMAKGVVTFSSHAFVRVPYFDIISGCPHDLMHIVIEGVTRIELAALIYMMTRKFNVQWSAILAAIAKTREHGCTPPAINTDNMYGGTEANTPQPDCTFPGTAHQVLEFALCSLLVLEPLIPEEYSDHRAWMSWKLHVEMLTLLMGSSFARNDVVYLDKVIYYWQENFLSIPEYANVWKPKFHWVSHFPQHIIEWGPPRVYWCMRFEANNQVVKALAIASNFKSILNTVACGMALRQARNLFFNVSCNRTLPILVAPVEESVASGSSALIDRMREASMIVHPGNVTVTWANGLQVGRFYFDSHGIFLARMDPAQPWELARATSIFAIQHTVFFEFHLYPRALVQVSLNSWKSSTSSMATTASKSIVAKYTQMCLMCVQASFITSSNLIITKRL
jgi:hypothetical protein